MTITVEALREKLKGMPGGLEVFIEDGKTWQFHAAEDVRIEPKGTYALRSVVIELAE